MDNKEHNELAVLLNSVESTLTKTKQTFALAKWILYGAICGVLYIARTEYVNLDQSRAIVEIAESLKAANSDVRHLEKDVNGIKGRLGLAGITSQEEDTSETTN